MPVPHLSMSEMAFGLMVLIGFLAFVVTLAGVHLYVNLPAAGSSQRARAGGRQHGSAQLSAHP